MNNTELVKKYFPHLRVLGDFAETKFAKTTKMEKAMMTVEEKKKFEKEEQAFFAESRQHGLDNSVYPFGVGGSDAGTIYSVGFKPPSHLYEQKLYFDTIYKFKKPKEDSQKLFDMGHRAEPIVRDMFEKKSGLSTIDWTVQVVNPKYPHCIANIDGLVIENGKLGIYEGKCASNYKKQRDVWGKMASKLKDNILPEINLVPVDYLLQVWFYMAVYEVDFAYICGAYTFHIDTVGYTRIPRLPKEKEEELMKKCEQFVTNTAARIRPSDYDFKKKTEAIKFYKEAHALLAKSKGIVSFPKNVAVSAEKYLELKKEISQLEKNLKAEKAALAEVFDTKHHLKEKMANLQSIEAYFAEKMYDKANGFIDTEEGTTYEVLYNAAPAKRKSFQKELCQELVSDDIFSQIYAAPLKKEIVIVKLNDAAKLNDAM